MQSRWQVLVLPLFAHVRDGADHMMATFCWFRRPPRFAVLAYVHFSRTQLLLSQTATFTSASDALPKPFFPTPISCSHTLRSEQSWLASLKRSQETAPSSFGPQSSLGHACLPSLTKITFQTNKSTALVTCTALGYRSGKPWRATYAARASHTTGHSHTPKVIAPRFSFTIESQQAVGLYV